MLKRRYHPYFILLFLMWLSGCATAPPASRDSASPSDLTRWQLKGKLAIIQPEERLSVNLHWQHNGNRDDLRLTNLFGSTLITLQASENGAKIRYQDKTYSGNNASELLGRLTGWAVPLTDLSRWILGQGSQDEGQTILDDNGWPAQVTLVLDPNQPPWQMKYQGWQQIEGYRIPRMVSLRQGDNRLKLALSDWQPELPR
ncbi:lipoprotein insertase outer membrane protein LolB [Ferrimonas sp.]|uniref:lipoprotein insertase outer membrane protein LolB n=1 Tax=Ferrimonas sp. TaxID=2080861 RepID=UPI003A946EC5